MISAEKLNHIENGIEAAAQGGGGGTGELSDDIKQALLSCFNNVAWTTLYGQDYYDDLYNALYPYAPVTLESITAVFTQGSTVIYPTDTLDDLKPMLVVTAHYSDSSTETITDYTLNGTLNEGDSIITVLYSEKTTTFTVNVSHEIGTYTVTNTLTGATNSNSAGAIAEGGSYSATITASAGYTLTGATVSVTMGGTDITSTAYNNGTISIASVTGNLVIVVTAVAITLSGISAVYTQGQTIVYPDTELNDLKSGLVVIATYSDSSTTVVTDYTLSGTLSVGTSTITVNYGGQTTTFTVTVSQGETWEYQWVAATSNHTAPSTMTTYGTPTWGTNDEYITVTDPRLQGATQTGLIGDLVVEVEMKWASQGAYSAGTTLVVSSAEKTGCKLFLANNSGDINLYSCAEEGGSSSLKTISTKWDSFHKYRFELVGTLCKTYIDGTLVDTGYTYYSSWNGYPVIWSENQSSGRCTIDIKSIKYRRSSNFSTIDGTDLTWTLGYINTSGNIDATNISGANAGSYTSEEIDVSGFSKAIITNVSATIWRHAFYDSSHTFMSRVLTAEAEIPSGAKYDRVTIMNNSLGNNGYDGTGTAVTLLE